MNFKHVEYFLTMAEVLNFTEAARRHNVAQPTLTKAIRKLEDSVSGALFLRDGKHTRLTKLGRTLHEEFAKIAKNYGRLKETASQTLNTDSATLNIGINSTISVNAFDQFFAAFTKQHPNIMLIFHTITDQAVSDLLLTDTIDCSFCVGQDSPNQKILSTGLFTEKFVAAFADVHAFHKLNTVPLELFVKETYIDRLHCEFRAQIVNEIKQHDENFMPHILSDREDFAQTLIKSNCGVSIMPERAVFMEGISTRPVQGLSLSRTVKLFTIYGGGVAEAIRDMRDFANHYDWE